MNADAINSVTQKKQASGENQGAGRPKLDENEKSDKTLANEASK